MDAYYAKLYGLVNDELSYSLELADIMGGDLASEIFCVRKNKDIKEFYGCRAWRLVLVAWDWLESGGLH